MAVPSVSSIPDVQRLLDERVRVMGRLDILANNADVELRMFTRNLAMELGPMGITITLGGPGRRGHAHQHPSCTIP